jgi:hypothetical protein
MTVVGAVFTPPCTFCIEPVSCLGKGLPDVLAGCALQPRQNATRNEVEMMP